MKTFVRFSFLFVIATITLSSCVKTVIEPTYQNDITGSWVLTSASQGNAYGWRPLYTGLENGVLTFYGNGSAQYSDRYGSLRGSWYINTVSSGAYYDYYGNYYTDLHQTFQVNVSDYASGSNINLYFDDINFSSPNYFTATYYSNNAIERYGFSRY